ncbi:2-nitropropane dioxygenase-like protein [Striga asiatica]|uniref:2-nitropropane dioxygenase-like protein n=1 Tax=Striga asiatica TaxID=4170 RepID=A0A5A7QR60_STRAF|nr:2-nitropropane dioxygenase-like protein [Striga asiatica]
MNSLFHHALRKCRCRPPLRSPRPQTTDASFSGSPLTGGKFNLPSIENLAGGLDLKDLSTAAARLFTELKHFWHRILGAAEAVLDADDEHQFSSRRRAEMMKSQKCERYDLTVANGENGNIRHQAYAMAHCNDFESGRHREMGWRGILGFEYGIVQASLGPYIFGPQLVAVVTNAVGLGLLSGPDRESVARSSSSTLRWACVHLEGSRSGKVIADGADGGRTNLPSPDGGPIGSATQPHNSGFHSTITVLNRDYEFGFLSWGYFDK